ncbi:hypothetical protein [Kitasatospora cheerisanensis]|uniref:Secreted protein n=1 Tax=Kitasatospora cheerisanensis KCTC 2395 TaxID=1348663 RepID=A0A066YLQ9_9ACTN|nr:hypothetical protein [Kitasatospora cheerisanensis]KDN80854.1 hypothetical protein KCH_73440 [Kitasatospora cheerisanensis KCTC 2395]
MQLHLPAALTALALGLALAPAAAADSDPADAPTVIAIGGMAIDPKVPSRVEVDLTYTCAPGDGPLALNTSVEQTDPDDPATIAFGTTRTDPGQVVCDGTEQTRTVVVQSKTSNWLTDVDAVAITTLADLTGTPPAFADAQQLVLDLPAED